MKFGKLVALPFLLLVPMAAQGQVPSTPPTVVIRVNSIDSLLGHVKFLVSLAGQQDAARQIEGLIKTKIGEKGLEGVDSSRPFGFYGRIGKEIDDFSFAILLPIADEKAFLNLLNNLNVNVVKGADGIHTIKTPTPVDAYLRFANKYAYITALNTTALDQKNLLDPTMVLAGKPTSAFALAIQLNQIPDSAKMLASAQAEQALQDAQEKKIPNESEAQKAFRIATLKEVTKFIAAVLKDGGELKAEVDIDQKAGNLAGSFALSGMPGTPLASGIDAIGKSSSLFAGLLKKDAVFNGIGHVKLPETLVKALGNVIDESRTKALEGIQDTRKKQQAESLFKVITPTFLSGDFDGALVVTSKGKLLTVLSASKVKGGDELGKTIRELVSDSLKDVPPALREKVKLDVDAVGTTKIHKVEIPAMDQSAKKAQMVLGDLSLYVAFRNDALFLALGKDGLPVIKDAIAANAMGTSPMLYGEVDIARLGFLAPPAEADKIAAVFPNGQGGIVRLSVQGGQALTVRLNTKVAVLQLMGQMKGMHNNP